MFARLHAIWGLGQVGRKNADALKSLLPLLSDKDPEVRAQAAKVLGEGRVAEAFDGIVALLKDSSSRVKLFAAMALGKIGNAAAIEPLCAMLRDVPEDDPWLRHAAIFAFEKIADDAALAKLAKDAHLQVRLSACVAMRRLMKPGIAELLNDGDVLVKAIAGIYRVEVSDARNCQLADLVAVSSIGGAEFDIQNIVPVTCFGFSDGSAAINVTSGIAPFSFRWSDGQTEALASKLPSGNYFATVTDGLGCNTIKPLAIPTPAPLETSFTKVLPNCVGDCDGSIEVVVGGGIMPYTTDWTGLGQQVTLVSGLCAGNYDLRITDSNNCILEQLVDLPDPEALKVNPLFTTPICMGRCDGAIEVSGQGGTGPYTFQWLNGPAAPVNSQLCPGGYDVTITDSHGCIATEQLQLADGDPLPIDLGGQTTLCVGQSRLLDAGEGWASVSWSSTIGFTSTNQSILITEPAAYFLTAIDPIGCMALDTFRLATSLDLLQAEFIMPSEAIVGDTLVAIDISWPLPERVEWTVPLSFNRLPSENPDFLFVVIPQEGTYTIAMQSFLAECRDTQEKQVVVLGPNPGESGGRLGHQEQLITHFTVFPNPNDGEFDVLVQLSEEKEIALQVVSFPKGIVEARYDGAASDFHQVGFSLKDLPQGIHFILLKVGSEQRAVRFVRG